MTPEERDRLVTLEIELKAIKELLPNIARDVAAIKDATNMGKGAWIMLVKLGAVLLTVIGAVAWVADTVARYIEHVRH